MSAPSVTINIKQLASTVIKRGITGVLAIILTNENAYKTKIEDVTDIPSELSAEEVAYITRGLTGADTATKYIELVVANTVAEGLEALANVDFNYLCLGLNPTDDEKLEVFDWVKDQRTNEGKKIKAVLANAPFDYEGIINHTSFDIQSTDTYNADEFCSRIAGLIAGTDISRSATYQTLSDVSEVNKTTRSERDTKCEKGEFFLFNDGRQIKVCLGVNSLTTFTETKTEDFADVKFIDTLDLIESDIRNFTADDFIGKKLNNYDNKILLCTKIKTYLKALAEIDLIESEYSAEIDYDSQLAYLKEQGVDVSNMSQSDVLKANTKDSAFIAVSLKPLRAMTHVVINITA